MAFAKLAVASMLFAALFSGCTAGLQESPSGLACESNSDCGNVCGNEGCYPPNCKTVGNWPFPQEKRCVCENECHLAGN